MAASDLTDLYQEVILDHNRSPRNFGRLEDPDAAADGDNPLCGDRLHLTLALDGDQIEEIRFEGEGCAISTASASLMTEAVKGRGRREVEELFTRFQHLLTVDGSDAARAAGELGKLAVMQGVRAYPMRVKCATLAWHTLKAALENRRAPVSTE